jgi:acetylornithine deacetylase/succinyl-diaminopimelate desuccinylase-like protein
MSQNVHKVKDYIEKNKNQYLDTFFKLLRCPSVSATGEGIEQAAGLITDMLRELGASLVTYKEDGCNPIIFGELNEKKEGTIMIYDHYDVQPVDPLDEWVSPPFEPRISDGKIYARGASDDKGNLVSRILAVKTLLEVLGEVPVNIKFLFDGEEEVGSPSLPIFVKRYEEQLQADACIWEGGGFDQKERPMIYLGAKGVIYIELRVKRTGSDLHSSWGTIVENPAWRLVMALSSIRDEKGGILIENFYEDVADDPEAEQLVRNLDIDRSEIASMTNNGELIEELPIHELLRRWLLSPTVNICGIYSGYIEKGQKTVLPSYAFAKIDIRLVPKMSPERVLTKLKQHLAKRGFNDVEVEALNHGYPAARTSPSSQPVRLAVMVARAATGKEPVVFPNIAGSGPMYLVTDVLRQPCFSLGINHPRSNIHAPNENVIIDYFMKGVWQCCLYMMNFVPWVRLGDAPYLKI